MPIIINELDSDTPGSDAAEFVELFNTGGTSVSLNGYALVFYNGATDVSYGAFDLDGFQTNAEGYFVIGNAGVPGAGLTFSGNLLQNGQDAVALYLGNAADFPNGTPVTATNVVDAVVYDTSDADDAGLISVLTPNQPQIDENANGAGDSQSIQRSPDGSGGLRNTSTFVAAAPSPGTTNGGTTPPPAGTARTIAEIQGSGLTSPFVNTDVTTEGVVTARDSNGFYIQMPGTGDGNDATSDGIVVFTSSAPAATITIGSSVRVSGRVSEFIPGGAETGNLSSTQITGATTTVLGAGMVPTPVVLGPGGRLPPTEIIIDNDPNTLDGRDFFESLEGMLVRVVSPVAVSPTSRFGEIYTVVDNDTNPANGLNATNLSSRGTINIDGPTTGGINQTNTQGGDFNPERIQINRDFGTSGQPDAEFPLVSVGARLNDVTGVVTYNFGNFEISPTAPVTVAQGSALTPEVTPFGTAADRVRIASYNVLNLDTEMEDIALVDDRSSANVDDDTARLNVIARQIVDNLLSPDIIGLQEIQDNDGAELSGETSGSETLAALIAAISAAGGPTYTAIDNTFIADDRNGGQPGGNIRNAFLYNDTRVDLVPGSVQTIGPDGNGTTATNTQTIAGNPFDGARLPLVATFAFNGEQVTVVNNHFSSKGGSTPLFGAPPNPGSNEDEDKRAAQAQIVNDFVGRQPAGANVVVIGDLNDFEFEEPLQVLTGEATFRNGTFTRGGTPELVNLVNTLPEEERYSFVFDGNSQPLDHIVVTPNLARNAQFDEVHVNTEFAETATRGSDHDPSLVSLNLDTTVPTLTSSTPTDNATGVARGANIVLTFSEAVRAGMGNITLSGGGDTRTIGVGDPQVTFSGNTVTINPMSDLLSGQAYDVTIASGVIQDAAGNAFAGLAQDQLDFTVERDTVATGPSSSQSSYLVPTQSNVSFTSIVTVGDNVPGSDFVPGNGSIIPGGFTFVGIPDGIGAYDNGDGTMTVLVNHELFGAQTNVNTGVMQPSVGARRDHGEDGAFISRLIVDKATLRVTNGDDLIKEVFLFDPADDRYEQVLFEFNRLCSADLPDVSAFFDAATGRGTTERIFMNGEETGPPFDAEYGRAFAHVVTGSEAGKSFELPRLGDFSWENSVASPDSGAKTVVVGTDDATPGQVYVYVGDKQTTGNTVTKAGLTNGTLYGVAVQGVTDERPATAFAEGGTRFDLLQMGNDPIRNPDIEADNGVGLQAESEAEGVTEFARPEDGQWDPSNPNRFYFVTTGLTAAQGGPVVSRLFALDFVDVKRPELGGTLNVLLNGTEGPVTMDNMTVTETGLVIIQEDPGGDARSAKIFQYDPINDRVTELARHDPDRFGESVQAANPSAGIPGNATARSATPPFNNNEESSGVIDVTEMLGGPNRLAFLTDVQAHASSGDTETVERGQLQAMFIDVLPGTEGNDGIFGGFFADNLVGNGGDDGLRGGSGDDTLNGGAGSDDIDGGVGGADRAVFSGPLAAYTVTATRGGFTVTGPDGTDTLRNVELLQFSDGTFSPSAVLTPPVSSPNAINGDDGPNRIEETDASDALSARGGDDTIVLGRPGQDSVDGGSGIDSALYSTLRNTNSVAGNLASLTVATPGGGRDLLTGVEEVQFLDGRIVFDVADPAAQVFRLYNTAFEREPDTDGFNHFIEILEDVASLSQVAGDFVNSPEFRATFGSLGDEQYVRQLYRNALDREPEPDGLAFWLGVLQSGGTRADVMAGISDSVEHTELQRDEVEAGLWDQDEGAASIARLYLAGLDRLPDAGGLTDWIERFEAGERSLGQIADEFADSFEFEAKFPGAQSSSEAYVDQLYENAFGRDVDQGGRETWIAGLERGTLDRGDVLLGIADSEEHMVFTQRFFDDGTTLIA